MTLLGWVWLLSPFVVIAVISHDPELLALVAAHHKRCRAVGWTGVAIMLLGVALIPSAVGSIMFLLGTPLAGLVVWVIRDDGDDGDGSPPDMPPINWGEFERSFWAYVRGRNGRSRHPRIPSAR
jgi:hypothetical protein